MPTRTDSTRHFFFRRLSLQQVRHDNFGLAPKSGKIVKIKIREPIIGQPIIRLMAIELGAG